MMHIRRIEGNNSITLNIYRDDDVHFMHEHTLTAQIAEFDRNAGPLFHRAGRVRLSPHSFIGNTADDLLEYARELQEVAAIAAQLQDEVSARYRQEYGQS